MKRRAKVETKELRGAFEAERLYLEVDGHLCPTREPKEGPEDQGCREAKAVLAFSGHDVAEVSKERHEILHKILQAQITDSERFVRSLLQSISTPTVNGRQK